MTIEQQHDNTEQRQSPGLILKNAREQRGLSQADIAKRLNLRLALVRDIEHDRFDQKTASTFTRGYLKTYAKFVGANEQDVLSAYDRLGLKETKFTEMHSFSGRTKREASEHRMRFISWILCLGLIGAGATWWWLQPAEEPIPTSINEAGQLVVKSPTDTTLPESTQPSTNMSSNQPADEVNNDAGDDQAAQAAGGDEQQPSIISNDAADADQDTQAVVPSTSEAAPTETTKPAVENANASNTAVTTASEPTPAAVNDVDPNVVLQLSFTAQCWLKITDASGKSLFEGTKNAGDKLALSGTEPFNLTIGAPRAVTVLFHGEPVDMSAFVRRGVVAKYKLPLKN